MRYTEQQLEFLREGYLAMRVPELTEAFNAAFGFSLSPTAIKGTLNNHKFRCGRPTGSRKGERLEYTQEQEQFVREHYPRMGRAELTEAFNGRFGISKTVQQVISFAKRCGITCGRSGCFQPGSKPWNTGTKGLVAPNSGQFKPGSVPANLKDEGFERVNVYGYIEMKVSEQNPYTDAPTRFKLKHIVVWEAAHGPVPKGHKLRFIDGDKLNCALENLELVSNAENLHMNRVGYAEVDPEMKPVAKTLIKLEVRTFRLRKEAR
ncbi:MAG: HNH endonuclease signature motif containing protein [Humidesulfovibrio sp.]